LRAEEASPNVAVTTCTRPGRPGLTRARRPVTPAVHNDSRSFHPCPKSVTACTVGLGIAKLAQA